MKTKVCIAAIVLGLMGFCIGAGAAPRKHVNVDGNRTRAVHLIPLYDETLEEIRPDDRPAMPFSTRMTCGDCHDYDRIKMGWHFNASGNEADPGRPGEPWVMADEVACMQLPISYRGWKGTWHPEKLGMSEWDFVKEFGRHMPGGDVGDKDQFSPDPEARWDVSGRLEINCLACHHTDPAQNNSEWAIQIGRENFRWAATGASGLGTVLNVASRLPEYYDVFVDGPNLDNTWAAVPEVKYDAKNFNAKNFVFFDVTREGTPNRCYSCHSSVPRDFLTENIDFWDQDVHMTAGMACTACHRNGLDHKIVRGYEGENPDTLANTLTCRGCHLGNEAGDNVYGMGGRLGAPRPLHRGFPPVHLDIISCTGCHSGPLPGETLGRIRITRGNRLGIHGRAQWDMEVPYIQAPVFLPGLDGKLTPHYFMYPAFWASMDGNEVTPLTLNVVKPLVQAVRLADKKAAEPPPAPPQEQPAENPAAQPAAAQEDGEEIPGLAQEAPPDATDVDIQPEPAAKTDESAASQPEVVQEKVEEIEPLTEAQVVKVLKALQAQPDFNGKAVYVGGGKLYQLDATGEALAESDHPATEPYAWPMAHDVRPATQSLGAGGCGDCHADHSGFFFAKVKAESPVELDRRPVFAQMYQFQKLDPGLLEALEVVAGFRVPLVIGGVLLAALLAAVVVHFGLRGLEGIFRSLVATGTVEK